tara:strand:+ start:657 stop:1211 length:555 start_codon:yes stop_codon:yes gene_type:complete
MSNDGDRVDDLLDDFEDEDVFYDPQMSALVPEGSYPATITGLSSKRIKTQRGNDGMLYKPQYRLDERVKTYGGRAVDDAGVWRFFGTKDDNGRRITGGSNAGYKKFLDKIHIPLQKIEIDRNTDEEPRVILKLPAITKDLILDKSVVISIHHEEWEGRDGHRRITTVATLVRVRNGSSNGQGHS